MVDRILAPVDDPSQTMVAIDLALALAAPLDAEVTLLHVIDPVADPVNEEKQARTDTGLTAKPLHPLTSTGNPQIEQDTAAAFPAAGTGDQDPGALQAEKMVDEDVDMARHVLETIAADNAGGRVPIAVAVIEGRAAEGILSMAHTASFDLIVMETRRSSAVARMVLGSTADEVARNSQVPVVLINPGQSDSPAEAGQAPRSIIVPLDRTSASEDAVPLAQELAQALSCELTFLDTDASASRQEHEASHQRQVEPQSDYLDAFVETARSIGLEADCTVTTGDAYSAISGLLDSRERPMVVMSASDKSGLMRLLTGSLPDQVARESGVPVLMVPERLGAVIE